MQRDVIIACDFASENQLKDFLKLFGNEKPFLKIGYQLFYATGRKLITDLISDGYRIFLDLKLHDIPNTVEHGIRSLATLGVEFITVHAGGGINMMEAAVKGVNGTRTKLLAVTQLTSIDQATLEKEIMIDQKITDVVHHYAVNALTAGVHGVICSAQESKYIKDKISPNLICVTPGIRLHEGNDDQARIVTPKVAHANKADFIVVGRPITKATDPLKSYQLYQKEFLGS